MKGRRLLHLLSGRRNWQTNHCTRHVTLANLFCRRVHCRAYVLRVSGYCTHAHTQIHIYVYSMWYWCIYVYQYMIYLCVDNIILVGFNLQILSPQIWKMDKPKFKKFPPLDVIEYVKIATNKILCGSHLFYPVSTSYKLCKLTFFLSLVAWVEHIKITYFFVCNLSNYARLC